MAYLAEGDRGQHLDDRSLRTNFTFESSYKINSFHFFYLICF